MVTVQRETTLRFRQFCDALWDLPKGVDEFMCKQWECPKDQFQCLSGHCIALFAAKNQYSSDWHCPDASDKIGLFRIVNLSNHNARLISDVELETMKSDRIDLDIFFQAFITFCDQTFEYPCILANVNQPLDFLVNRPCINLTSIGDGITHVKII